MIYFIFLVFFGANGLPTCFFIVLFFFISFFWNLCCVFLLDMIMLTQTSIGVLKLRTMRKTKKTN